jgi:hypothetical protein
MTGMSCYDDGLVAAAPYCVRGAALLHLRRRLRQASALSTEKLRTPLARAAEREAFAHVGRRRWKMPRQASCERALPTPCG